MVAEASCGGHLGAGLVDLVVTRVVLRFGHDLADFFRGKSHGNHIEMVY